MAERCTEAFASNRSVALVQVFRRNSFAMVRVNKALFLRQLQSR